MRHVPRRSLARPLSVLASVSALVLFAAGQAPAAPPPAPGDAPRASAPAGPAAPTARADAPIVRYVPVDTLIGYSLPFGEPWSPAGPWLAVRGRDGFCVYDLDQRGAEPRRILDGATRFAWAPAGPWLACWIERGESNGLVVAVDVESGEADTLLAHAPAGWPIWSGDGAVHFVEQYAEGGLIRSSPPPSAWKATHPEARRSAAELVLVRTAGSLQTFMRFDPSSGSLIPLAALPQSPGAGPMYQSPLPDGRGFLMLVWGSDGCAHTHVVDVDGRSQVDFGPSCGEGGFSGTTVSSDVRYVIGNDEVGDGHVVFSQRLYLADASGEWIAPIEGGPMGGGAKFSSRDLTIAFEALDEASEGVVHVGRLEIIAR